MLDSLPTPSECLGSKNKNGQHISGDKVSMLLESTPEAHTGDGHIDEAVITAEQEKERAVAVARQRLLARATEAGAAIAGGATPGSRSSLSVPGGGAPVAVVASGDEDDGKTVVSGQALLNRDSLYGFNKLQSAITELANSGGVLPCSVIIVVLTYNVSPCTVNSACLYVHMKR